MSEAPLTVRQVNARVKSLLERQPELRDLTVVGELGGVTLHSSGHLYFTLKDPESELAGVMYRTQVQRNRFSGFKPGDRVVVSGSLVVYEPKGRYQVLAERMVPDGIGALYAQLLRNKALLEAEGLLDPARKRPLPAYPRRVALITSATGAVRHDIETTLARRRARVAVTLYPATVQGEGAPASLLAALAQALEAHPDLVIIARGGGSLEDLWCFNEPDFVRALAQCPVPLVTAIGHETDTTLADLVADLRAPTPTAAAELIAPSEETLLGELAYHAQQQRQALMAALTHARRALEQTELYLAQVWDYTYERRTAHLTRLAERLDLALGRRLEAEHHHLERLALHLAAHDPEALLARGYTQTRVGGKPLRRLAEAPPGSELTTYLADGELRSVVPSTPAPGEGRE
ncbi:MAG: exodeoxyribonuclease VII large subunit [Bacteroidia bacterium]|nr:exodeoxyribonuclease VII large subunit [Bacteroidia bacterium]